MEMGQWENLSTCAREHFIINRSNCDVIHKSAMTSCLAKKWRFVEKSWWVGRGM